MQFSLTGEMSAHVREIDRRLQGLYGPLPVCLRFHPVDQLVLSLIGARTQGEVSLEVFRELRSRLRHWSELFGPAGTALAGWLEPVTYPERKAAQLRQALRMIRDRRGALALDFLASWPVEDAQAWLRKLPGIGPKVSAAVLNFSTLRKRVLVVDCHHFRVAKRLGLLGPNTPFPAAQRVLMNQHIPNAWTADDLDDHHRLVKRHGQMLCLFARPLCARCPLQDLCLAGQNGGFPVGDDPCPDEAYGSDERFERWPAGPQA